MLSNWLQKLDRSVTDANVEVVVMTLFLYTMKSVFKVVLAMRCKSRLFRGPSGMCSPFIVEDCIANLVTATAFLGALLLKDC